MPKKKTIQASDRKITYNVKENGKADTGRPNAIDDNVKAKLIEIFHIDGTVEEACWYAGIDVSTFYRKYRADEKFCKEMKAAMQYPFIVAKKTLFKTVLSEREDIAQRWATEYLKRREPRYKDKVEWNVDMNLDVDAKLDLKDKSMIDLEELRKWLLGF